MDIETISLLLVFAPLISAILVGLTTRLMSARMTQFLTISSVLISAICAMIIFKYVVINGNIVHIKLFKWIECAQLKTNWSIFVDALTAMMLMLVTVVSTLVHLYSVGYMSHDAHRQRFMSYLSLFTFFMICLVTADNFFQMFFGWEGVGLASYLLIGFWFKKGSANNAAMKAFIVNRIGDFGFALGIFMSFWYLGSVEFQPAFAAVAAISDKTIEFLGYDIDVVTLMCLLLFVGAMGKSAQLGLHTWLPDAMEGPTPVSALIHAATMVTAGVFMVARCSPIFEYSSTALTVVTCVGAFTCLFGASVALVQNDIKRIIAYSTCSQLGYMFFACGVSAYAAGIFHLLTHGFFKALLFLGAGSVIHAMSGEQDIRKMGGIWKKIPFTYVMMWIGSLALAGVFPFAGFYSKDGVLEAAMASGSVAGQNAYWVGLFVALLTALYSWRLIIKVFHGAPNASHEVMHHVHESPFSMTVPLGFLAIGSVLAGMFGVYILGIIDESHAVWGGAIMVLEHNNSIANIENIDHVYAYLPIISGISGIALAYFLYGGSPRFIQKIHKSCGSLYNFLLNKWYFDELYHIVFVRSSKRLGKVLWHMVDGLIIDGIPNGAAYITQGFSRFTSALQTGFIYHYAIAMMLGLLALLSWTILIL